MIKVLAVITVLIQNIYEGVYYAAERYATGNMSDNEPFDASWMDAAAYLATK